MSDDGVLFSKEGEKKRVRGQFDCFLLLICYFIKYLHYCSWWKKKKTELRKKRDETAAVKSSHLSGGGKRKVIVDKNSRPTLTDHKRGFRSSIGAIKIQKLKQESSESDTEPSTQVTLSQFPEIEPGVDVQPKSDSEAESVKTLQKFTNKPKQKAKLSSKAIQKHEVTSETPFKKRFILFLGNLPHAASQDDVIDHFSKRGVPITELRLLTDKETGKSKGCAFAEFSGNKAMENALKFHRSKLQGRTINVEVTCGGGGKGNERLKKIRERNRTLRRTKTVKSGKVIKKLKART